MIVLHGPPRGRAEHKRAKAALALPVALSGALYWRMILALRKLSWALNLPTRLEFLEVLFAKNAIWNQQRVPNYFKSAEAKLDLWARHLSCQLSHVTMIAGVRKQKMCERVIYFCEKLFPKACKNSVFSEFDIFEIIMWDFAQFWQSLNFLFWCINYRFHFFLSLQNIFSLYKTFSEDVDGALTFARFLCGELAG